MIIDINGIETYVYCECIDLKKNMENLRKKELNNWRLHDVARIKRDCHYLARQC